ncbi:MAG: 2Fe-2S iron-sulfur cluster binding domain-containing protein [Psychromonas sp.]|nr:2Fe-2S iron-sulfur cluster binding domain-containing protein [Psychromonas sp.]
MTKILSFNGEKFVFNPDMTILENLESHGIAVEYQCRQGYCGACRRRVTLGKVNYIIKPLVYLKNDEILICCSTIENDLTLL